MSWEIYVIAYQNGETFEFDTADLCEAAEGCCAFQLSHRLVGRTDAPRIGIAIGDTT